MHLKEIIEIFESNKDLIDYTSQYESGSTLYVAKGLIRLREGLTNLGEIGFLEPYLNAIYGTSLFDDYKDIKSFSSKENNYISNSVQFIQNAMFAFILYYKSLDPESEDTIKVKLPYFDSFEELAKISNELKIAVSIPVIDSNTDGNVKVITAEPGSVWLTIALSTVAAVKLIGAVCWSAAVIRKKWAEASMVEANIRTLNLTNDAIETVVGAQKKQFEQVLDAEAAAIANNFYDLKDPETIERLKLSIKTVSELIEKGAKFIPESKDESIKSNFPDYSNLNMIETTIKKISENN